MSSVEPKAVVKCPVRLPDGSPVTAASIFGNRIQVLPSSSSDDHTYNAFIASGGQVFSVSATAKDVVLNKGKDAVFIPSEAAETSIRAFEPISFPGSEVQSLALHRSANELRLYAADDLGHVAVASTSAAHANAEEWKLRGILSPASGAKLQQGWAGCAASSVDIDSVAVARHLARDVQLFKGDQLVWRVGTSYHPTAVRFLSGPGELSSLVAVAEGPQVTLYDARSGGKVVHRLVNGVSGADIPAMSESRGYLGVIGRDRSISVWDQRGWKLEEKTSNVVKYEATAMNFSTIQPDLCYCAGLDYEVWGGQWKSAPTVNKKRERDAVDGPVGRAVGPSDIVRPAAEEAPAPATVKVDSGFGVRVSGRSNGLAVAQAEDGRSEVLATFNGSNVYFTRIGARAAE